MCRESSQADSKDTIKRLARYGVLIYINYVNDSQIRTERSLPLRQRQEIQEVLRPGSGPGGPLFPEEERTGTPMDEYFALLPFLRLQMQKTIGFEKDGQELKEAIKRYEKRYRPGKDDGILDSHYVSWRYFDFRFGESRRTVVERVMAESLIDRLVEPGPTGLRHMAASYATFYEVIDPGPEVVILEELGTGRRWNVMHYHDLFETPAERGEVWYTRLLGPPEQSLSYTTPYVWGPETRAQFERGVRSLAKDFIKNKLSIGVPADRLFAESQKETALFWTEYLRVSNNPSEEKLDTVPSEWPTLQLPHIINNDREDFVFTEMDFKVKDEQQVRRKLAALKSLEYDEKDDSWTWLKAPSRKFPDEPRTLLGSFRFKEGRLVAETNSRERALRLEEKLMGHLPGLLRLEKTTYRQPDDLMAMPREEREAARKEAEEFNARPEVREALKKYHEDYYFEKMASAEGADARERDSPSGRQDREGAPKAHRASRVL